MAAASAAFGHDLEQGEGRGRDDRTAPTGSDERLATGDGGVSSGAPTPRLLPRSRRGSRSGGSEACGESGGIDPDPRDSGEGVGRVGVRVSV